MYKPTLKGPDPKVACSDPRSSLLVLQAPRAPRARHEAAAPAVKGLLVMGFGKVNK